MTCAPVSGMSDARAYTAAAAQAHDRALQAEGMPGLRLMRRAAQAALTTLQGFWPEARRVAILAGPGHNGGDGAVLAGLAQGRGLACTLFYLSPPKTADAQRAQDFAQGAGVAFAPFDQFDPAAFDLVVDGLLGTGPARPVRGTLAHCFERVNAQGVPVLALDLPSGLDADTGAAPGAVLRATVTQSLLLPKRGAFTGEARNWVGTLTHADLTCPPPSEIPEGTVTLLGPRPAGALPRPAAAHKGIFGRVLVVAGGVGMGGAGLLAAEAALRAGAGAVTLVTAPDHVAPALARCPELMVRGITHRRDLAPLLARADAVLLGPGLGLDGWARQLFGAVLEARLPTVFDADGLTLLGEPGPRALPFPALLTPHPGEAGRLLGCSTAAVESDRFAAAAALAQGYGAPTVLKGAGAIIASEAGLAVSLGGNSAMATAGMGDVLAGLTVGLWAQGLAVEAALTAAVQLHGEAGDRAGGHRGPSLLARDLFDEFGPLLKAWAQ